jgi:Domain of unknown function (DUF4267)
MVREWSLVSGGGRIAIGAGLLVAPELALRTLGFSEVSPATVAVARIAGIRDLVMGAVTFSVLDDPQRLRTATIANATADAGDTAAFAIATRSGERQAGLMGLAAALPAALAGAWVARRLS